MTSFGGLFAVLIPFVVSMYVLYWVIRYAVRDGIRAAREDVTARPSEVDPHLR